ncbi:MAG: PaaI family thioesterase [Nitratireductor sp.]
MSEKPLSGGADPVENAVRLSFGRQSFMKTLGADLAEVGKGRVRICFGKGAGLLQQHGYLHAGVSTAIVDSACGYAALSLAPHGSEVLTIEFKTNFLKPASGSNFEAVGEVIKPGKTIMVCEGKVWERDGSPRLIATMTATMMVLAAQ